MNINNLKSICKELEEFEVYNNDETLLLSENLLLNQPLLENINNVRTFEDVKKVKRVLNNLYSIISRIEEDNDIKEFNEVGKSFDYVKLKKIYYETGLKNKFKKFDIDRYLELLENPIREIKNFCGETIKYDIYWIKKNLIAINQMVFNEMDLYILNIGKEGSGKSCWSSQQILYFYTFLKEVGLIEYAYDIKKMFFIDINSFLENHENQGNKDYFNIECLDEGNQLNRQDFRDEDSKQFKYEMRTERKMLRIIMINMQQIGELDTSISLSRVNFIYDCRMKSDKKNGLLKKGFIDMYIIPRGDDIYSVKYMKLLTRLEILNTFSQKLDKKKDYYISLPRKVCVNSFKFTNNWGFDKDLYDDFVKDKMKERRFKKKQKLTDDQAFILMEKFSDFKYFKVFDTSVKSEKRKYDVVKKFFNSIKSYFESNPVLYNNISNHYSKK